MKKIVQIFMIVALFTKVSAQSYNCPVGQGTVVENNRTMVLDSHFIGSAPLGSTLAYCSDFFTLTYGGSYTLNYIDQGGTGMDAYPNIIIGGAKINNKWVPGNSSLTGMPVTIANISDDMSLEWKVSQENAFDSDDKWMASINFIFDNTGTQNSEPLTTDRDYDLVIKSVSQNFSGDDLTDNPITSGDNTFWYFARESNGNLKPYTVTIDGISYTYAVRYKFFQNSGDKDNKVHLKFIPYGPNGVPPVAKINIKNIISATKNYIPYANLPQAQLNLANSKVALNSSWLKSINAGYEIYTGESILKIEKYKIHLQNNLNNQENTLNNDIILHPNPSNDFINIDGLRKIKTKIEILDTSGRIIKSTFLNADNNQIDVKFLMSGVYWLKIFTFDKKFIHKKIIINK